MRSAGLWAELSSRSMTYAPDQSGYPPAGPPPRPGERRNGRDPDFARKVIMMIMIGLLLVVIAGLILVFRPFSTDRTATPSPTSAQSSGAIPNTAAPDAPTVTVTVPPQSTGGTSRPTARASSPTPTSAENLAWPPEAMSLCDNRIAVNQVTSCAFAEVISDVWSTFGPGTYQVDSPTTGQTYTMTCQLASPDLGYCFGGNDAEVYVRGGAGEG